MDLLGGKELPDAIYKEDASEKIDRRLTLEKLWNAFASKYPKEAQILSMYFFHEQHYGQIGEQLNIPAGRVRILCVRAFKLLQEEALQDSPTPKQEKSSGE